MRASLPPPQTALRARSCRLARAGMTNCRSSAPRRQQRKEQTTKSRQRASPRGSAPITESRSRSCGDRSSPRRRPPLERCGAEKPGLPPSLLPIALPRSRGKMLGSPRAWELLVPKERGQEQHTRGDPFSRERESRRRPSGVVVERMLPSSFAASPRRFQGYWPFCGAQTSHSSAARQQGERASAQLQKTPTLSALWRKEKKGKKRVSLSCFEGRRSRQNRLRFFSSRLRFPRSQLHSSRRSLARSLASLARAQRRALL